MNTRQSGDTVLTIFCCVQMSAGNYWDVSDTHHMLPVYASGRAVTSTSFDSLMCQVSNVT